MALVRCKKCDAVISDKAAVCPKCGADVQKQQNKSNPLVIACEVLSPVLFVISIAMAFGLGQLAQEEQRISELIPALMAVCICSVLYVALSAYIIRKIANDSSRGKWLRLIYASLLIVVISLVIGLTV
ncbi:MAG: zinc ribbon domain-containing protein [Prevotella sp.]|nr:zinc ribbon domain-containing protein [Prevotella sp.]